MAEDKGYVAKLEPSSVGDEALNLRGFPSDAWERTAVETDPPVLTLKSPWNLACGADLSCVGTFTSTGAAEVGGNFQVLGTTKAAGHFYAGTTNPSNTTRLNYDGNLHVTNIKTVESDSIIIFKVIDSAALAVNQVQSLAHGIGALPSYVQASLLCISAEANYSVNNEIFLPNQSYETRHFSVAADATNFTTLTAANAIAVQDKSTAATVVVTMNKWKIRIRYLA